MSQSANPATWRVELPDETSTTSFAAQVAGLVGQGDLVTLTGDLGAGKTTFARALIRHICNDPELEAPSPSFTLMQIYDGPKFPIVHADLYRVESAHELVELGWDEAAQGALVLVEWADRIGEGVDPDRLDIAFALDPARGDNYRQAVITGHGAMAGRLDLARAIGKLLEDSGWANATRNFMLGDASVRAYERLEKPDGSRAILMISPARPDGPPVRFGKSYSTIARLAENIEPFIAMAQALRDKGLSAPQVYACDRAAGLAILEDLGHEGVLDEAGAPILERYMDAASVLAFLHVSGTPDSVPVAGGARYSIAPYDHDAMLIEVDLLPEWYGPHVAGLDLSASARALFLTLWRSTLEGVARARDTWVLRDYHSPNLIWLPGRTGLTRVGIIDFQDCVMGHPAYDVASLLQDARVTVPDDLELRLLSHYAKARRAMDEDFDMAAFAAAYAILGAQRATKILGIFARLNVRDGKPQYLAHIPRMKHYLAKSLAHPALAQVKGWYKTHMPGILEA